MVFGIITEAFQVHFIRLSYVSLHKFRPCARAVNSEHAGLKLPHSFRASNLFEINSTPDSSFSTPRLTERPSDCRIGKHERSNRRTAIPSIYLNKCAYLPYIASHAMSLNAFHTLTHSQSTQQTIRCLLSSFISRHERVLLERYKIRRARARASAIP